MTSRQDHPGDDHARNPERPLFSTEPREPSPDSTRHEQMASPISPDNEQQAAPPSSSEGLSPDDLSSGDLSSEEEVLRQLLQGTVEDLRPSPGALNHLHTAVPARRALRRNVLIGAVASLTFGVTAVPALIHTVNTASGSTDRTENSAAQHAGHGGKDGPSSEPTRGPGGKSSGGESHRKRGKGKGAEKSTKSPGRSSGGASAGSDPTSPPAGSAASCLTAQLSQSPPSIGAAGTDGKIYGSFRVVNISQKTCSIKAPGELSAAAQGGADPARVHVAPHTAGDPAGELPGAADQSPVLSPGSAYLVRFGWVPESGTTGCQASSETTSGGTDGSSGTEGETGGQAVQEAPEEEPGSVRLSYTPAAGGPSASGQLDNVCAGTVYYTAPVVDG